MLGGSRRRALVSQLSPVALTLILVFSSYAWNEPDNFRGLKFGEDLTKTISECIGPLVIFDDSARCWLRKVAEEIPLYGSEGEKFDLHLGPIGGVRV